MKKKMVWRYYCEYCKKSGCNPAAIKKHESRCTMNSDRTCGLCEFIDGGYEKENLEKAKKILIEYRDANFKELEWHQENLPEEIIKAVREYLDNCPACILSALRQSDICVYAMGGFEFDKESKERLADHNNMLAEEEEARYMFETPYYG